MNRIDWQLNIKMKGKLNRCFIKVKLMNMKEAKEKYSIYYKSSKIDYAEKWQLNAKDYLTNFSEIEKKYKFKIHPSVYEYFNSYYHDYIIGTCMTDDGTTYDNIILLSVLPLESTNFDEFLYTKFGFCELLNDWYEEYGNISEYTPIGWSGYYGASILVENATGKIKVCWNEYNDLLEFKTDSLADLIVKMGESLLPKSD